MPTARFTAVLWVAFSAAGLVRSAEPPGTTSQPIQFELTGDVMDGPNLAHTMMHTFMTEQEWKQRVADCRKRYVTWEQDNHGDMGQFLNDRLVIVALGAAGGGMKEVQNGVAYLALYKEFAQVPPGLVLKFLRDHKESVTELLSSFTWGKASDYVKNKRWREDIARWKAKAREERAKVARPPVDQTGTVAAAIAQPPVQEVPATLPPVQTAEARPADPPCANAPAVPPAALQAMSLRWDLLSEPFMAETPLRPK